jgi:hypothetical protein
VAFCDIKAVDYVDADRVQVAKRKDAFTRFSNLLKIER